MKSFSNLFLILGLLLSMSLHGQGVEVIFSVNMSYMMDQGIFNKDAHFVDVAGDFNGWDGKDHHLTDTDGDEIYEISIGNFTAGQTIEFKFRIDGKWDGREEFPGGGDNRRYSVVEGVNNILVWYNNEIPAGEGFSIALAAENSKVLEESVVQFYNQTIGQYEETNWIFENGIPGSSTVKNPLVKYKDAGEYDVTLIVKGVDKRDTIILQDYVKVGSRDEDELDWWNDAVFYEIFVRSFKDSDGDGIGDFNGLTQMLDYLNDGDPDTDADLGITGIWLMPIHPSPSYHGYDVTDYQGIHPDYGTIEDFKKFLDAAHERGIRVIIDLVLNHSSSEHPWFVESASGQGSAKRDWYNWRTAHPGQTGPWGQPVWHANASGFYYGLFWSGMPDLNYDKPEVKDTILATADFWLNEVGIDGFRLDAVKYIKEDGNLLEDTEGTFQFWKEYQSDIKALKSDAFSVGEAWTSTDLILEYVEDGGLDICFEFGMADAIIQGVNNRDAGKINTQAQKIYNVYPNNQFGTFLTNHDMDRVIEILGNSREKLKTAAAIYLTLPGTPFIYYGEEVGMKGRKPDEFIRRPMQWSSGVNGGFTTGTPWINLNSDYRTANVATLKADPGSTLQWYDQLIQIRNDHTALRRGMYEPIIANDNRVFSFLRSNDEESILVLINLSTVSISTSLNGFYSSLSSGQMNFDDLITGISESISIDNNKLIQSIALAPGQVKILKSTVSTATDNESIQLQKVIISPVPAKDFLQIKIEDYNRNNVPFSILDLKGKINFTGTISPDGEIDISNLSEGVYLLHTRIDNKIHVNKFVKL